VRLIGISSLHSELRKIRNRLRLVVVEHAQAEGLKTLETEDPLEGLR
jgi:hypothetical protein